MKEEERKRGRGEEGKRKVTKKLQSFTESGLTLFYIPTSV
jgi:hypothetical protein